MSAQDIVTLIQSVGFPIVMCGLMEWDVKYFTDKNREQITAERAAHKEEMNEVVKAINNNTIVIERLIAKLDAGGEKVA